MVKVRVSIHFINKHQGGWRNLPSDMSQYACTAKFLDLNEAELMHQWSLVIDIDTYSYETGEILGLARFLADNVPEKLVFPMRRFELYEGPRFVGHGIILNDGDNQAKIDVAD